MKVSLNHIAQSQTWENANCAHINCYMV
uniref:Uncharacterized protein n=1 Tax=Rhizophora mucronata TaxID=61149 RepID=A0A2P2NQQ0_RHIMU